MYELQLINDVQCTVFDINIFYFNINDVANKRTTSLFKNTNLNSM